MLNSETVFNSRKIVQRSKKIENGSGYHRFANQQTKIFKRRSKQKAENNNCLCTEIHILKQFFTMQMKALIILPSIAKWDLTYEKETSFGFPCGVWFDMRNAFLLPGQSHPFFDDGRSATNLWSWGNTTTGVLGPLFLLPLYALLFLLSRPLVVGSGRCAESKHELLSLPRFHRIGESS